MFLIAAFTYALHPVQLPAGWSEAVQLSPTDTTLSRPVTANMARNGSIAVLLARTRSDNLHVAQRLLIVRADGTRTILRSESPEITRAFRFLKPSDCQNDEDRCPYFENVTLARDGTPFATLAFTFGGAYSGISRAAFMWNGKWHRVPRDTSPFAGTAKPFDPDNVSIGAADTAGSFAFVGDFQDSFPAEDLEVAGNDPHYMAEVSGAAYDWRSVALGEGNATAMRGAFIAGFYADLKLVASSKAVPTVAITWHCAPRSGVVTHPCVRSAQHGLGVAYGVDSNGYVVGDDEHTLGSVGFPILWRNGKTFRIGTGRGSAYSISEDGTIVGVSASRGFVANANDAKPRAHLLDSTIPGLGARHVQTAFGIADDGRILCYVVSAGGKRQLAVLTPIRTAT